MAKHGIVRLGPEVHRFIDKWAKRYQMTHKDFVLTMLTVGMIEKEPDHFKAFAGRGEMTPELANHILEWDGTM